MKLYSLGHEVEKWLKLVLTPNSSFLGVIAGEVVSGEELGGATMHCSVSGITDYYAKDEEESFQVRPEYKFE